MIHALIRAWVPAFRLRVLAFAKPKWLRFGGARSTDLNRPKLAKRA